MDVQHDNLRVLVPVSLMRKLIFLAEAQSDALVAEYANQMSSDDAHHAAEDACRVVMDAGFPLDG